MHKINRRTGQMLQALLILALLMAAPGMGPLSSAAAQAGAAGVEGFHLVSAEQGWVLTGNQLYWTTDGGDTWSAITPPLQGQAAPAAVDFIDSLEGRVLTVDASGEDPVYSLAVTHDGGATWESVSRGLFAAGDVRAVPDKVFMQWLDAQTGWLVVKQASGINFSLGSLFRTDDGGLTWRQLSIPIGEEVTFVNEDVGWTAGGAAGDELYRTEDGGETWTSQAFVQAAGNPGGRVAYSTPDFEDVNTGLLAVTVSDGSGIHVDLYATGDGGGTWTLVNSTPLDGNADLGVRPALRMLDASHSIMLVPGSDRIVSEQGAQGFSTSRNLDGRSAGLTRIDMANMQVGLGLSTKGECTGLASSNPDPKGDLACTQTEQLLKTTDGGATWNPVVLPGGSEITQSGNGHDTMIGQGVDMCEIASAARMQAWWTGSPYGAVNLYIGGSMRACSNSGLNASVVSQLFLQGWKFVPTWVGPQAPCTSFLSRVSLDPVTAHAQGISEADAAVAAASALGLTKPDGSNTVIYYDLEGYNTADTSCRDAMKYFMDGWDGELAAKGNASGVYGSACSSGLKDFAAIAHVPDSIWVGWWNFASYDPTASVLGLICMADTYWPNHQRIHQYAGDHDETWGGITINVDNNVMDGVLAVPYESAGTGAPGAPAAPKPVDGAILPRTSDTWLYWTTNGSNCNLHLWSASLDTTTNGNCDSRHLGAMAPGIYLWQVTAINANGSVLGPTWHFSVSYNGPNDDFNGDGRTDLSIYRPSTGTWYIKDQFFANYGLSADIPVPGDYNGDGKTDVAVYRPSAGTWYIKDQFYLNYGLNGDIPVLGDYNGDGVTDIAVYRPSSGTWYIKDMSYTNYGLPGDIPVPGDYNGDGKTDIAVYRPSTGTWYVKDQFFTNYGLPGDIPIPGDYNGDGKTDVAVYRPSAGTWYVQNQFFVNYGLPGDIAIPGDYNGDGITDIAVYRPSAGTWYVKNQFFTNYGIPGDIPLPEMGTGKATTAP